MGKTEPKLCINRTETIGDFNYAFTAALLKKLKGLKGSGKLYEEGSVNTACNFATAMAASVIGYLVERTKFPQPVLQKGYSGQILIYFEYLESLIAHTEEFLSIFEVKEQ